MDENNTPQADEPIEQVPAETGDQPSAEPDLLTPDPQPAAVEPEPEVGPPPPPPEPVAAPAPPAAPAAPAAPPQPQYSAPAPQPGYAAAGSDKNKVAAGILAILLGSLGVHKFYLGYNKEGVILLAVTVVGSIIALGPMVASVIGIVEGVIYLTKTDQEFYDTYVAGRKPWF